MQTFTKFNCPTPQPKLFCLLPLPCLLPNLLLDLANKDMKMTEMLYERAVKGSGVQLCQCLDLHYISKKNIFCATRPLLSYLVSETEFLCGFSSCGLVIGTIGVVLPVVHTCQVVRRQTNKQQEEPNNAFAAGYPLILLPLGS